MRTSPKAIVSVVGIAAFALVSCEQANASDKPSQHQKSSEKQTKPEAKTLTDAQILGIADAANGGEVEQATVAEGKAHAESVKEFARMMVKDHGAAKQKGGEIARQLGIAVAPSPRSMSLNKESDDTLTRLHEAKPEDFDKTYMRDQVRLHEKVLGMIDRDLMPQADASQVKSLLSDMRGRVAHHLAVAHSTLNELEK